MKQLLTILLFNALSHVLSSANQDASEKIQFLTYSWFEWFSNTFYKTLYIFLVTGIVTCCLYNFVTNKLSSGKNVKDLWFDAATSGECSSFTELSSRNKDSDEDSKLKGDGFSESENQLRLRLKSTQEEIQALREQLAQTLDTKAEMESTLALLDKEKISSELQFEMDRVEGAVELEKIRKDNFAVRREIQKTLEDKELAEKEAERLELDIKICKTASVDAEFLEKRLDTAKKEADHLRQQFTILALEKGVHFDLEPENASLADHEDLELERNSSWTPPDLAREYLVLD